jgi:hypothetical protein
MRMVEGGDHDLWVRLLTALKNCNFCDRKASGADLSREFQFSRGRRRWVSKFKLVVRGADPGGGFQISTFVPSPGSQFKEFSMKNIQVIDGADNCVYDVFQVTEAEFDLIFAAGTDIAFIDDVYERSGRAAVDAACAAIWRRRIPKKDAQGIHGLLFYELAEKKVYYPTRRDEEAINPNGARLR